MRLSPCSPILVLLVATLSACGGTASPSGSPAVGASSGVSTGTGTGTPETGIHATFDGKALSLAHIESASLTPDEFDLFLSSDAACTRADPGRCGSGTSKVSIRVARTIEPDGSRSWRVVRASVDSSSGIAKEPVKIEGDASSKITLTIPKLTIGEKALSFDGPLVALGHAEPQPAESTPQKDAKFTVEGVALPIVSAYLERGADADTLHVYAHATTSCHSSDGALAAPGGASISVPKTGAPTIYVTGDLIPNDAFTGDVKKNTAKLGIGAAKDGITPVTVSVENEVGDYSATVSGTVYAKVCD